MTNSVNCGIPNCYQELNAFIDKDKKEVVLMCDKGHKHSTQPLEHFVPDENDKSYLWLHGWMYKIKKVLCIMEDEDRVTLLILLQKYMYSQVLDEAKHIMRTERIKYV